MGYMEGLIYAEINKKNKNRKLQRHRHYGINKTGLQYYANLKLFIDVTMKIL